ncbi:glutathione S-transferase [Mangrovimicrobium sediminis]|uniref:Glutathione S-transferase n=1 Tax=Mangrovimicrobium sediminis TaxID=2562682 RepID=A0A4Z0LVN4_9GAMM|nr:glutathione S-transferase N-terminal domain-containing protein [Haliea sp. SAOS-164]TGD71320.1 glutathione S-transferase [Haliea sp. SAOS-164]
MSTGIELFYFPSPNGKKISIALEEMELPYTVTPVNILRGEQQAPAFLEISPNNRIPALVDCTANGQRITLFESGAILQYLGRKSGKLYPSDEAARCQVDSWLFWQMAGLGPMAGQLSWFLRVSNIPDRDERDYGYPIHRYRKEVRRLYGVLERQLQGREYICDDYSIADISAWTWVDQYHSQVGELDDFGAIMAWHARIAERPAVLRGCDIWHPESNDGWSAAGQAPG